MTLLFGRLTQDFITFTQTIRQADLGDVASQQAIPEAAQEFRNAAAKNASYLVYIGSYYLIIISTEQIVLKDVEIIV